MSSKWGKPGFTLQWEHNRLRVWVHRQGRGLRIYPLRPASHRRLLAVKERYPDLVRDWGK